MAISEELRAHLEDVAEEQGVPAEELIAEVQAQMAGAGADGEDNGPTPGKNDPAKSVGSPSAGAESGAKAHGGRGYFAYEYPFLTANEVRASLFLGPAADGDLYTGEWLAKHGGSSGSSTPPPATE